MRSRRSPNATRGWSWSTFQLGELERAALKPRPRRTTSSAALRQVLASAERVERLCAESYASLYESDDAVLATPGRRLAARRGAGGARPAVPAVSRRARRHQVAARGPGAVSAPVRRRHRGVAGAAAAGRGAAGAARAAEAQVRADAGRRHRAARRAAARAGRPRAAATSGSRELERAAGRRARGVSGGARNAVGGAAPRGGDVRARARGAARRARDGADAVRGPVRRAAAGGGLDGARHRRGGVLRLAESGRGPAAAGAHRLRRRAVAHHAGDQDADRDVAARLQRRRPTGRRARRRPG